ncbi:hypothetical protein QF015_002181 [Paenarthrobacter sp. TE4293]|uniref:hypothetical protein n=1 Tax=Paenarthrobacter sp. TE4293 TaxID=3381695 RepID=UPI003D1D4C63
MNSNTQPRPQTTRVADDTFSMWRDLFDNAPSVTANELTLFKAQTTPAGYAATVLHLARTNKLAPEVLTDAVYSAWLYAENPKKALCGSGWAELFRLAYNPDHEFFERMN